MVETKIPLPRLLPGEKIIYIKNFDERPPARALTSLEAIERLARAKNYSEIGKFGPVLAAGPLEDHQAEREFQRYGALFGRDSLRVAMDLITRYSTLARTTLIRLAELQGVEQNDRREEEPGRIIHEARDPQLDPVARELTEQRGWGWPYYGSVDATPEFVRTFMAYCRHEGYTLLAHRYVGRDGRHHTMAEALEAAVDWILRRLGANPEGLLEFHHANPGGIENQAWKDSWDSYFHAGGEIANHRHGIASVEVQRVAYDALLDAAECYDKQLRHPARAQQLREQAEHLDKQIMKHFWSDEHGGYFVLGTDRDDIGRLRQLAIRTSNMGHLLHSRLLVGDDAARAARREAIIRQLFSPEMLSYSGIRTLATDEIRFRPGAYHNGSVWVWDNYLIIQGLQLHGYWSLADFLTNTLLDDIESVHRMPEYLRGDLDRAHRLSTRLVEVDDTLNQRINRVEQPPQDVQAWTAAAILAIKLSKKTGSHAAVSQWTKDFEQMILADLPSWQR